MVQSTVRTEQAFGVPGDVYDDSPRQALPYILDSATTANIVGRAFTVASEDHATIGGDAGVFAGILINSKAYVNQGTTAGGTLAPTLQVQQETVAELMTKGRVVVDFTTASNNIGNVVYYNDTTGAIGSAANAGAIPAGNTEIVGATVTIFTVAAAGLGVINLAG